MKPRESEDSSGAMQEVLDGGEAASWGPTGPDGGPLPGLVNPVVPQARPWDAKHVPCLRDCRHYMAAQLHFEHGNYDGALGGHEPIQDRHICRGVPGVFLELSGDAPVYECSAWDPLFNADVVELKHRRSQYFSHHPEPVPDPPKPLTEQAVIEVALECFCEDFGAPKFEGVCSYCVGKSEAEAQQQEEDAPDGNE